jgi:sugar (pentulose or hexulose) kinase
LTADPPSGRDGWLLGVDIGTSSVKALAVGLDGRQLAYANVERPMHRARPGWAENDPEDWVRARGDLARHVIPDEFIFEVCIESTGSSLRWFRDEFAQRGGDYLSLIEQARPITAGADGLYTELRDAYEEVLRAVRPTYGSPTKNGKVVAPVSESVSPTLRRTEAV